MVGTIIWNIKKLQNLIFTFSEKSINDYILSMKLYEEKCESNLSNISEILFDTTKKEPLVSVVTPSFNAKDFLPSLAQSLSKQTIVQDIQWVVVDDCSTDGTQEVLEGLCKEHRELSIKILKNKTNGGAAFSLNRGFQASDGKYVAWISADDEYIDIDKLEKDIILLENGNDVVFSKYTVIKYTSGDSKIVESVIPENNIDLFLYLTFSSNLNGSSLVLKKEKYLQAGGFDENLWNIDGDYDLFVKLALLGSKFVLSNSKVLRRVHGGQTSNQMNKMKLGTSLTRSRFARVKFLRDVMVKKIEELDNLIDSFNLAANFSFFFLDISENIDLPMNLKILRALLKPNSKRALDVLNSYKEFVTYMFNLENFQAFVKNLKVE